MSDDLGLCDRCHGEIGERGWMKPTGRTDMLSEDGPELPVWEFYCSRECVIDGEGER